MAGPVWKKFAHQEHIFHFQEKASGAFAAGDLVYLDDSTGQIVVCGADPANILGIARKAVTGTAGTLIPVDVILPGDVVKMDYSTTTAQAKVGDSHGIVTTTGALTVDATDTTNYRVTIVGIDDEDAVGTSGGALLVTFIPKYLVFSGNNIA